MSYLDTLLEWIGIDSTSGSERNFLEVLETFFQSRGYTTERFPVELGRWNLLATIGNPRLVYSTHVDTVPPFIGPRVEDGIVFGRGACDTKGGLMAMCEAAEKLRAEGQSDIGFLLVVGEEVDHCGAKHAMNMSQRFERIILCEPTENQVVVAQKGMVKLELRARGIAGHSAFPERGESAVHKLLSLIRKMEDFDWPTDEHLGPTTMNVGVIQGGVAANVFAPFARAEVLIRAVSPVEALIRQIQELAGDGVEVVVPASNDPVFFDPPTGVETTTVPFNTDATYLSELGPVWLVGPGDIRTAHSDHEHIRIDDLERGIELYAQLGRLVLRR